MKIIKKTRLTEAANTQDAKEIAGEYLKDVYDDGAIDLTGSETNKDLEAIIAATAVANGQQVVNTDTLKQDAKELDKAIDLIVDPYHDKNGKVIIDMTQIDEYLQDSLEFCLEEISSHNWPLANNNYPNVLILGQSGAGKTTIIEKFCKMHNLDLYHINCSTATIEKFTGIPYAMTDDNKQQYQGALVDRDWVDLQAKQKKFIIFFDEINRAKDNALQNPLLEIIANHRLITSGQTFKFPSLLFCVGALNPATADGGFEGTIPLDRAMSNRFPWTLNTALQADEFKKYFLKALEKDLQNPYNSKEKLEKIKRQIKLADAIVSNPNFSFDTFADNRAVLDTTDEYGYEGIKDLSYRTLEMLIRACDGTKKSFLKMLERMNLTQRATQMLKNCVKDYKDIDNIVNKNTFDKQTVDTTAQPTGSAGKSTAASTINRLKQNMSK